MYRRAELEHYLRDAAAKKSAPGGGSVSALVGSLAAAMSEMAANFSTGKAPSPAAEKTLQEFLAELASHRDALLALVDRDVEAYEAVSQAYALPKANAQDKECRRQAVDKALANAIEPPLDVMRRCARIGEIADRLADVGNPRLITDVGVSAVLAEAACAAARYNVEVNLKLLKDAELSGKLGAEMDGLTGAAVRCRESVHRKVAGQLES